MTKEEKAIDTLCTYDMSEDNPDRDFKEAILMGINSIAAAGLIRNLCRTEVEYINQHWQDYHSPAEAKEGYEAVMEIIERKMGGD